MADAVTVTVPSAAAVGRPLLLIVARPEPSVIDHETS